MNRPKLLHIGGTAYWVLRTYNPDTQQLKDADSTPAVVIRKNGASTGDSVTITKRSATTGIYDCSYNPASEIEGDKFTVEETATVTGTTTASASYSVSWEFTVVAIERGTDGANTTTPPTANANASQVRTELTTELARIDQAVSADTAGITTLLSRLTSGRAGNLDNLDIAISTIQSQVTALNNLSAKANWFGALLLEVPDSSTRPYVYELVIKDDEDKLANLDGLPTIALVNHAGIDRSALITTPIANPSTGRYTLTISIGTGTVNESLKLTASGTISGEARYGVIAPQVVDYDSATQINAILTTLGSAGAGLTNVPWNATWDAEVQSEVQDAIVANHLNYLFATQYDSTVKPGLAQAWCNNLVSDAAGNIKFTPHALEDAPVDGPSPNVVEIRQEMDANSTKLAALDSRLTASRASYLDNLNVGGALASQADIVALNQSASRRIILTTVGQYERPESGSTTYTIEARTYDGDGAAVNADSSPSLTMTGQTSGSLAANLGAVTNPSTGVYRWSYTQTAAATLEPIRGDVSATISGSTFTLSVYTQSVDFVAATWSTADAAKLTQVYDRVDENVSAAKTLTIAYDAAKTAASQTSVNTISSNVSTILGRITASVYQTFVDLAAMITGSPATPQFTVSALSNAPSGGGGGGTSPDLLIDTTIATLASQTVFTLTAGSPDDESYRGQLVVITDSVTSAQKAVCFVESYVGSSRTVTLKAAGAFEIAVGDSVAIIAVGSSAAGDDASETTLNGVQETVDAIATTLSGTRVTVTSRVSGSTVTAYMGDDFKVRSDTQLEIAVADVGGVLHTKLAAIGGGNLAFGASRECEDPGEITGDITDLSYSSNVLTITVEITACGDGLEADEYDYQIQSTQEHSGEYDDYVEVEGTLVVKRRTVAARG